MSDRAPTDLHLALREVDGNLTMTRSAIIAWYALPPTGWYWRSDEQREQLLTQISQAWTGLIGRDLHLRVTQRPYPASLWAYNLDTNTPNPGDQGAWAEYLRSTQEHMRSSTLADTEVYLGVTVAGRRSIDRLTSSASRSRAAGLRAHIEHRVRPTGFDATREHKRIADILRQTLEIISAPGMHGREATQAEVEWLLQRSRGLGLPEPIDPVEGDGPMSASDLFGAYDQVTIDPQRAFTRALRVIGAPARNGHLGADDVGAVQPVERYVSVMSIGRMEPLTIPENHDPWMAYAERLPFPVEWSARFRVLSGADAQAAIGRKLDLVRDQSGQYANNDLEAPPNIERTAARARHIRDEMENADELSAARVHGVFRVAVSAPSEAECLERARRLTMHYKAMRVTIETPHDQMGLAREFIPGEAQATVAHTRRMEVRLFAAALPQIAASVGDREGQYLGWTSSTARRAVTWNPHRNMEIREGSGLAPIAAKPGAGKSVLIGDIIHGSALRGIDCTVLDPSGPLARLTKIPALAPFSRHIDLLRAESGTLSPYAAIPTPVITQFREDPEIQILPADQREDAAEVALAEAKVIASHARRALAMDIIRMLLPPRIDTNPMTEIVLTRAVNSYGGDYATYSINGVVDRLAADTDPHAQQIADHMRNIADMPQAGLLFGVGGADTIRETLLVLTMPGLVLPPPNSERQDWSIQERWAVPLMHMGAYYTTRRIYGGRMASRKVVAMDEAHFLGRSATGRDLIDRLSRDSRKWNARVLVASQNPADILGMNVENLTGEVFVGRIDDPAAAVEALRLLQVPVGVGYEAALAALSPVDPTTSARLGYREFVMRDCDGNVGKVRIDLSHQPDLLAALDTTASQTVMR